MNYGSTIVRGMDYRSRLVDVHSALGVHPDHFVGIREWSQGLKRYTAQHSYPPQQLGRKSSSLSVYVQGPYLES
jgi:hypothetical protein